MNLCSIEKIYRSLLVVLLCGASLHAQPTSLEAVEQGAGEWVKTRAETVRLQDEWSTQRPLLESMVNGMAERAKTLEEKRDFLLAKTAKDREEVAKLETANRESAAGMEAMENHLKGISDRLLQLRTTLPPRLADALNVSYRSLEGKDVTLSERMQLTVTVLNRCLQFNRSITCDEEVISPGADGKAKLMDVIYWGLSHAYALDRVTGSTWFGSPGPAGWRWEPLPDATQQVTRLIDVYHSKLEPRFVDVPARLKNITPETSNQ